MEGFRRARTARLATIGAAMTMPAPPIPDAARRPHRRALAASGMLFATALALIALGHDGRRIAQLLLLALPMFAWLLFPVRSALVDRARTAIVWLWAMAFALDGIARAYLLEAYQAAPDSSLVLAAAANTNGREAAEYLSMHWRAMLVCAGAVVLAGVVAWVQAGRGMRAPAPRWPRWAVAAMAAVLLLGSLAYASKPWRRLHPALFWKQWAVSTLALRATWADQQKERDRAIAQARDAAPVITREGPATLVLVITDSINRDNMSLYGYARDTTPRLRAHKAQLQDEMLVVKNAWSVDASTLPALRNIFRFGRPEDGNAPHLLALARAAGYKVWWMSNHDDIAIEQQHARLADVVDFVNRVPGRAGASLDGELLDCVQEALEDPAERKLIVVHLMGAHPHYRLRFPEDANPFDDRVDGVEEDLQRSGRSAWVRKFRQEYDAALLYHDFVVSETLQLTRRAGRPGGYRAWMYLSDHGQEVGHAGNHAGHSPSTPSGYRIPTVIWRNTPADRHFVAAGSRPFRADWAGWTLADLLHMRWQGYVGERNAVGEGYRWVEPALPMAVTSFEE